MKNILRTFAFTLFLVVSSLGVRANTNGIVPVRNITEQQQQRLLEIEARVNEIKDLDKSKLTSAEKKELRTELKALKKEARKGGGIYISTAAVVIIVLLLVILL
jgi:Skp family chaperone for outer membrane proteins